MASYDLSDWSAVSASTTVGLGWTEIEPNPTSLRVASNKIYFDCLDVAESAPFVLEIWKDHILDVAQCTTYIEKFTWTLADSTEVVDFYPYYLDANNYVKIALLYADSNYFQMRLTVKVNGVLEIDGIQIANDLEWGVLYNKISFDITSCDINVYINNELIYTSPSVVTTTFTTTGSKYGFISNVPSSATSMITAEKIGTEQILTALKYRTRLIDRSSV